MKPVGHTLRPGTDVARQPMAVFGDKALEYGRTQSEIRPLLLRPLREVSCTRCAAAVDERRVYDPAAPATLPDGEAQVAVEPMVEPVGFVEAANGLHERAREAHTDRVDDCGLLPWWPHGRPFGQAVHDRSAHEPTVSAQSLHTVEARDAGVPVFEGFEEPAQPLGFR